MSDALLTHILILDTYAIAAGCILDLLFGDPAGRFHPVCYIGKLISALDKKLYRASDTDRRKQSKGVCLTVSVTLITVLVTAGVLGLALAADSALGGKAAGGLLYLITASLLCDSTLAVRDLRKESMQVASALRKGLPEARKALSCIVGRDTENLDEDAVIRAAVETVAENTTDGVAAPLFFLFLGGPAAAMAYKAVNTMDSMIGYKNERYLHFGRAAARLDDVLNFIPARIAALLWIIAAGLCREDRKGAWRIWRRDRYKHESPNSAQTESACAGSLQVALAGDACYFGKLKRKPVIGDPVREITPDDIRRANRMMTVTSVLTMAAGMLIRVSVLCLLR
jgi:adenosylcobinamide-phosphate synthase